MFPWTKSVFYYVDWRIAKKWTQKVMYLASLSLLVEWPIRGYIAENFLALMTFRTNLKGTGGKCPFAIWSVVYDNTQSPNAFSSFISFLTPNGATNTALHQQCRGAKRDRNSSFAVIYQIGNELKVLLFVKSEETEQFFDPYPSRRLSSHKLPKCKYIPYPWWWRRDESTSTAVHNPPPIHAHSFINNHHSPFTTPFIFRFHDIHIFLRSHFVVCWDWGLRIHF